MTPVQAFFRVVALIGYFLSGAWDIACAVENYKAQRYFRFGVDIMLTFLMMLMIVRLYIQ